jgi:hypothetical protein
MTRRASVNITEQQYAEMMRKRSPAAPAPAAVSKTRKMNSWEQAFSYELKARQEAGELVWWAFEPLRFRLADGAWYKPDFGAVSVDGVLTLYEIKGHWRESARVRIKVAADRHPFRFIALRKRKAAEGGGWDSEVFAALLERLTNA